ncbi:MAG: hypothetical protein KGN79_12395 [Acidobacteriota bacterium]|nr:hypothetical protein [Acidobacteriota bacterium]
MAATLSRAEMQADRCARTQCPKPYSRRQLRALMWLNRKQLTSEQLFNTTGRKPGWERTHHRITDALTRQLEAATAAKAEKKKLTALKRAHYVCTQTKANQEGYARQVSAPQLTTYNAQTTTRF